MDAQQEDYFAPLGMSQSDFNSMLRRRNLANLTQHLVQQGRVTLLGTGTSSAVPYNTAQLVELEDGGANFAEPLVAAAKGGRAGGGAQLTEAGRLVLERYRDMERRADTQFSPEMTELQAMLRK